MKQGQKCQKLTIILNIFRAASPTDTKVPWSLQSVAIGGTDTKSHCICCHPLLKTLVTDIFGAFPTQPSPMSRRSPIKGRGEQITSRDA